jgi:hypothetical protein
LARDNEELPEKEREVFSGRSYAFAAFRRFAQAAFIFCDSTLFCAAVMGLRFLLGAEAAVTGGATADGLEAF